MKQMGKRGSNMVNADLYLLNADCTHRFALSICPLLHGYVVIQNRIHDFLCLVLHWYTTESFWKGQDCDITETTKRTA
jgi:hypothetical protein